MPRVPSRCAVASRPPTEVWKKLNGMTTVCGVTRTSVSPSSRKRRVIWRPAQLFGWPSEPHRTISLVTAWSGWSTVVVSKS